MDKTLSASARRVQEALAQKHVDLTVVELPASTRTAPDAAKAVGCRVAEIAKSLVFKSKQSKAALLVIASGSNRVDMAKLKALAGEPVGKADADFVRSETGYAIGGIPPVGHLKPLRTFIDADLMQYPRIWAAAGTPHALFALTPDELLNITAGQVADLKET